MADPQVVRKCIRAMWAAAHPGTKLDDDREAELVAIFAPQLQQRTDDAVKLAANEWVSSEKFFPRPIEFIDLARRHEQLLQQARALSPAQEALQTYPVGRAGMEGVAAKIVIQRMLDAVAREVPRGYLGRARGFASSTSPSPGLSGSGHDFNDSGMHATGCRRCHQLAAIAYEQAVDFPDSTLSWDRW